MITTLFRIIKYGFQNFYRNGLLTFATIVVLTLTLAVFQGLVIFQTVSKAALLSLQDKIDISAYFKSAAPEDEILKIERSLRSLAEVKEVEYVSREKALQIFKERHKDDATIAKALEELGENPLSASLNVKAKDPKEYSAIAAYLENEQFKTVVEKVTFGQNQGAINRLVKIIDTADAMGVAMTIALALIAIIVTFNTVRLAIYSNREEIGVMRLVGASNAYIRGPYVVEGVLYGAIAAAVVFALVLPIIYAVNPYVSAFIPGLNLISYFYSNALVLLGYTLLLGMGLGILSSSIAITRYLRV
jgi:cell division transport system permease protein